MPTILLLDVSLSMSRPVAMPDCVEEYQRRHLAVHGINAFLDYMALHSKLEFVSLVVFSSLWEQLVPFTRDYDSIKAALNKVDEFNKTCLETALSGVKSLITEEWGSAVPTQVVLITDGSAGIGEGSLKQSYHTLLQRESESDDSDKFPLPFNFPCKLHVVCIAPPGESSLQSAEPMYQKLIDVNGHGGQIYVPESVLNLKSVCQMFTKLAETDFAPMACTLKCGHLQCEVLISPSPQIYDKDHDFEHVKKEISGEMEICGFISIVDVSSPPHISRHLVLPRSTHPVEGGSTTQKPESTSEETEESEDGKTAAFTVLLHGALKIESMVALTQLADNWYGILYSYADSKKKANLMLTIFQPGSNLVPWLGNLRALGPLTDMDENPFGDDDNKTPFPVKPLDRRSYTQNCVVWIKPTGLQADIQKVLRNARKLPEKQQHFYKELNRVRRAALSFGFIDLLDTISQLLDRECTMLPGNAHPDAALQLTHAANALRTETVRGIAQNIQPLRTNFSGD